MDYKAFIDFDASLDYVNFQDQQQRTWIDKQLQTKLDETEKSYKQTFNFMDGPPFVTGNLHWGHLTIGSLKSSILNYWRMKGYKCSNKIGYDCHGVPIEAIVNKDLNIKTLEDLQSIGIEKFNQTCKDTIKKFEGEWKPIYEKLGRWADFSNPYKTMDCKFMESCWWAFNKLYNKNLVYRKYKVAFYSYPLQSPLSNFEVQQNYKTKNTKSVYIKFPLDEKINDQQVYIVAWTTTPWTLVANCALCVNAELEYNYIMNDTGIYIVSKDNCSLNGEIIRTVKGAELVGKTYHPYYRYTEKYISGYKIIADNYVQPAENIGTSVVHLAPAFGEDDNRVCLEQNIITNDNLKYVCPIDENCKYTSIITNHNNKLIFDAEPDIIQELKESGYLLKTQMYSHEYPYCYRTDTPLVSRTVDAVYVRVSEIKERMIELNKTITWHPSNIGSGRFHNWLENARDWCVSRSRYFGTPIPMWINEDGDIKVIESIAELKELANIQEEITDLHPEFINKITFKINDKIYKRIPDVFDCWYESGCVPIGQIHYPFENSDYFDDKEYLSDFIAEGLDQTRGWFYTLLVLSTALFNKAPFKRVNVVGLVLDENGEKFSKKKKNYVDAELAINEYGADVLRLYVLGSQLTNAEPLKFRTQEVIELKQLIIQYINCVKFYGEHTINLEKKCNKIPDINAFKSTTNFMDCWIIETINSIGFNTNKHMNDFDIAKTVRNLIDFIETLTNYYIKFNRDRMKGKYGAEEWMTSLGVLYYVLKNYNILLAPFAPFLSDYIWSHISKISNISDSIHQLNIPDYDKTNKYIPTFNLMIRIAKLIRSARCKTKTHTSLKTPIYSCDIFMNDTTELDKLATSIDSVQTELNCMNFSYGKFSSQVEYYIEVLPKEIGKRFKKDAQKVYELVKSFTQDDISEIIKTGVINFELNNTHHQMTSSDFIVRCVPKDEKAIIDGELMIKLDFTYSQEIINKHNVNNLITCIQQKRKELGLRPWNKINIIIYEDNKKIVSEYITYIRTRLETDIIDKTELSEVKDDSYSGEIYIYENTDDDIVVRYGIKLL